MISPAVRKVETARRLHTNLPVPELRAFLPLAEQAKSLCQAHECPSCRTRHQVTAERVIEGDVAITRCHCRHCGHSWHPQVDEEFMV